MTSTDYRLWAAVAAILAGMAGAAGLPAAKAQGVDIEAIFWCGPGDGRQTDMAVEDCTAARDSILLNCTTCHSFVPIVKAQKSPEAWEATLETHRSRVAEVPEDEYALIRDFLVDHFNPDAPPPTLPPELEALGTQQAF